MVRTYRQDKYQLVSPWEKAMRTVDASEGRTTVNTGKRVYADMKVTQSSLTAGGQKNLKLPPITKDPQQMITFLGEEVGKALCRSKEKIKAMKKEFVLYDPSDTGQMSKSSAFEILQRYKVPTNENYQKNVLAFFVNDQHPGKINYKSLIEFFENSTEQQLEKLQFSVSNLKLDNQGGGGEGAKADSTYGRFDSTSTMNQTQNKPRKAHLQAFAERRDVGLQLEIERALKNYTKTDPDELLDRLEDALRTTCRNDDFLTDGGHVRGLVSKTEIPLNTALILKCIERLDPQDTGTVEWPKFMAFLRKAVGSSPRRAQQITPAVNQTPTEFVPSRPAWETRQPLSRIGNHNDTETSYQQNQNNQSNDSYDYNAQSNDPYNNENAQNSGTWNANSAGWDDDNNNNNNNNEYGSTDNATAPPLAENNDDPFSSYMKDFSNGTNDNLQNLNGYNDGSFNTFDDPASRLKDDQYPEADVGADAEAEAAFARNIEEIRKSYQQEEEQTQQNSFEGLGERGELYKRVANALQDKASPNKGMLLTNDVRKIINYYNLLFDANFPLDQINSMLQRFSNNDEIHCDQVVGMLGKQIV